MNVWLFTIANVAVAGMVGGVTNHMAIKMLFHPRRPWVVFGRRLPFTPGLIPKRKGEIAAALGQVVEEYLVTPGAVRKMLLKRGFRSDVLDAVYRWVDREIAASDTMGDLIRRWAGEKKAEAWLAALPERAGGWTGQALVRLWERDDWGEKRIRDIVPGWSPQVADRWAELAAGWGLDALKNQLISAEGQALMRKLAAGMIERQGGFIGLLAGIFVDEEKLVARLTPFLEMQLESEALRSQVSGWLSGKLLELGELPLKEALGKLARGDDSPERQLKRWVEEGLPWKDWAGKVEQFPVGRWLAEREDVWKRWCSAAFRRILHTGARHVTEIMKTLRLQEMVTAQVERFPIDRLEQVILGISGKEFRAITWLGVLLGGMIGLIQSILIRLWPGG